MNFRILVLLILVTHVSCLMAKNGDYGNRQDVKQFVKEMVAEGFEEEPLQELFSPTGHTAIALAERICGTGDRLDPTGMS